MATYTPNYNLSKPEATDDFDAFRASYGDNMDILDNNLGGGGGGGGGHTIVDPNGTDMPQENKLQFTGAVNVSDDSVNGMTVVDVEGGGNYYLNTLYSTEEKKIGYWTDGMPVYQKTVLCTATIPYNSWVNTGIVIDSNADRIIGTPQARPQSGSSDMSFLAYFETGGVLVVMNMRNVNYGNNYVFYITVQYTKSTDTPELNPQTGGVIYLPTIYSEEEREIGCFVDGKPLYQKTISFGALPNSTSKSVAHGISDLDKIVDFSALAKRPEPFNIIPLPSSHYQSTSAQQEISFNATNITIRNGNNASAYTDVYVTLQYTKTTDTAGSGSWTPSGANAVHYSTNEQVIGTWLGKTLYEKVYVNNGSDITANSGNWTTLCSETWAQNVKQIVNSLFSRQAYSGSSTGIFTPCEFMSENGAIKINPFRNLTFKSGAYFVIQYTKD